MNEQQPPEDFRSQVQRLVAEGKLTAEEAAGLLEPTQHSAEPEAFMPLPPGEQPDATPPDLDLVVSGYSLNVVHDSSVQGPQLSANTEGAVTLNATGQGWRVARSSDQGGNWTHWNNVKAILSVPFAPRHVRARVDGGNLTLPDLSGEMQADVNGGNIRMGRAAGLKADVNGGNLTAAEMNGPTHLSVNGGNLTLTGAQTLNASVNGGNLKWAGVLSGGDHRVEVNAGNATLHLLPGSGLRVNADVTMGAFKADFPTSQSGGFMSTRHAGQFGDGSATLSCKVALGQIKLVTS
ncbi:hypothetical protein [Deinococcus aerophilus]|uniref:Adhesin domain-containing protein n=1 Tax=Deinococcus aerophilus TaxID=522488 RepID=A0ABQ2GRN3_9DEIO|nr:hypothetical protein [Deinococcus aerophilus]GGM09683.1 hypothetical protein GCM10010841_17640 [Deinococcus aerophilus]